MAYCRLTGTSINEYEYQIMMNYHLSTKERPHKNLKSVNATKKKGQCQLAKKYLRQHWKIIPMPGFVKEFGDFVISKAKISICFFSSKCTALVGIMCLDKVACLPADS